MEDEPRSDSAGSHRRRGDTSRRDLLLGGALAGSLGLAGCSFPAADSDPDASATPTDVAGGAPDANQSGEIPSTITADWIRTRQYPTISVDAFGAAGDGVTDDAEAIQAAVDSVSGSSPGVLSFSPGKVYLVGSTVEIPPGNIRGIEGNNALIALQGSVPAINYAGEFDSSSGPSSGNNRELITQEFVSYIRNLHVYGSGDLYRGTGIALDGTLGTIVSGCHCFQLHTGIQVTGRQRNLVFLGNHLFDNEVAGIAFRGTNLHQVNLVGNHVMWSMAPIEATGSKLFNVQLTGNDIEVGGGTDTAIRVRGGTFTEVQVAGNTIQGHGCKRILDVEPDTFKYVVIANNHLSNCDGDAVRLSGPTRVIKRVTVSDNTFKNVGGHAIAIGGREVTGVSVTGNNVEWGNCARVSSSGPVRHVQIANNVAAPSEKSGDAIGVVSEDGVSSVVLTGNVVRSSQSDPGETDYLCRIEAGGVLEFTTVTDNQLRTDAGDGYNGLRVAGDGNDGVIVRNNVVGAIGQEATAFELPDESGSQTITSPNIGIPGPR